MLPSVRLACLTFAPRVLGISGLWERGMQIKLTKRPLNPARNAARVDLVSPRPARVCHQW
ncbi:unnamed protein product [Prunus armeniaca]